MTLKRRLGGGEPVDGIVVRTPSHQVIEVLAARGTRCVMIDTEHSAIDGAALDAMLAVSTALGVDVLVRVPTPEPTSIQRALDTGATGVVVPHVDSASLAAAAVRWAHYGDGGRGYSGSTRSGGWGTRSMADVLASASESTVVVAQVEDLAAITDARAIAATPGLDAVFVGASDLAVSLGETSPDAPSVRAACDDVIAACRAAGRAVVAFAGSPADAETWRSRGASLVFHGTDQSRLIP